MWGQQMVFNFGFREQKNIKEILKIFYSINHIFDTYTSYDSFFSVEKYVSKRF